MVICAQSLSVRTAPAGAAVGVLGYAQSFDVVRVQNGWVYGFAYGNLNAYGWVQDGWFC